jgi:hypothetical protein
MSKTLTAAEIAGKPSMSDLMEKVQCAVNKVLGDLPCGCYCWVSDLTETDAIVTKDGEYFRYPYTLSADGEVELGTPVEVKLSWKDAPDADDALEMSESGRGDLAFVTDMRGLQFSDAGPVRIEVCRDGQWDHPKFGKIDVTPEMRQRFKENFDANVRKVGDLPLDYDHERGPAPGWITALSNEGGSLFADVQMTPTGRQKVQDGEYRFFSPEWVKDWKDPETGSSYGPTLFGGGFTNKPFFRGMAAIQCSEPAPGGGPLEKPMDISTPPAGTQTATEPAENTQQFAEQRIQALEMEVATLRATEVRTGLTHTFSELAFGEHKGTKLAPASTQALVDALVVVPEAARKTVIDAISGLQFADLTERGISIPADEAGETLTAGEEAELKAQAQRNGLKFEELRANFLEVRKSRRA